MINTDNTKLNKESSSAYDFVANYITENLNACYRIAFYHVKNEQAAMDVVQEAAIKALRFSNNLRKREAIRTWLYRIIINECMYYFRKNKNEIYNQDPLQPNSFPTDEAPDPANQVIVDLDLQQAIRELPHELQTVIILRYFEDCKLEDIAKITGVGLNTVKSRLHRAVNKLKILYKTEED